MKILIVTSVFPPIATGSSFYSRNLAEALFMAGHEVTLVTVNTKQAANTIEKFNIYRLNAIPLSIKGYFKHFSISSFFRGNYLKISEIIRLKKTEIVLLINQYSDIAFPVIYAARHNKIPLIISIGTQIQSSNPFRHRILSFFDRLICGRFILPHCDCIISWDKEIDRYIRETHKKVANKSVIIPFAVTDEKDHFLYYQHPYQNLMQITGVGAIIDQRNYIFQIRVFKELIKTYPLLKMKIIGHVYRDDALRITRTLNLEKNIIFTGELGHKETINEIKKSTLHWMMLSGKYRGLGTSNAEAMFLGVPVISNIPEDLFGECLIEDMKHFIYTDGISINNTVNKITTALKDEKLRRYIGTNGKKYIISHMNWQVILDKLIPMLHSAIKNHQSKRDA